MSKRSIDETILTDKLIGKTWKCPHCGKRQKIGQWKNEELMEFEKTLQHCGTCGYVHIWKLELSDKFKRSVVDMLVRDEKE